MSFLCFVFAIYHLTEGNLVTAVVLFFASAML